MASYCEVVEYMFEMQAEDDAIGEMDANMKPFAHQSIKKLRGLAWPLWDRLLLVWTGYND